MKKNFWSIALVGVACSMIGVFAGVALVHSGSAKNSTDPIATDSDAAIVFNQPKVTPSVYSSISTPDDFVEALEHSIHGVVNIRSEVTLSRRSVPDYFDPFEYFFGIPSNPRQGQNNGQSPTRIGIGSGVIISTDGYIITNNHVISGASKITVTTNDNKEYIATIVGTDPETDIALLKIDEEGLRPIPFGDSEALRVGEWVLAIGNPFNLSSTVTAGIVSAKGRNTMTSGDLQIASFIQTDAAVNPGNSGGALVNTKGELVGINTMIYSETGNYAGYSFAVPVSIARKVVSDIRQYGTVQRAVLGIVGTNIRSEVTEKYDLNVTEGAVVLDFAKASAAKSAGLREGDVITAVNGTNVRNMGELQEQVSKFSPGNKVNLTVDRKGKTQNYQVELKNREGTTEVIEHSASTDVGATFKTLDRKEAARLNLNYGVLVSEVERNGKFADAGIRKGFVILSINNTPVKSAEEAEQVISGVVNNATDKVLFIKGVLSSGRIQYVAVDLS